MDKCTTRPPKAVGMAAEFLLSSPFLNLVVFFFFEWGGGGMVIVLLPSSYGYFVFSTVLHRFMLSPNAIADQLKAVLLVELFPWSVQNSVVFLSFIYIYIYFLLLLSTAVFINLLFAILALLTPFLRFCKKKKKKRQERTAAALSLFVLSSLRLHTR